MAPMTGNADKVASKAKRTSATAGKLRNPAAAAATDAIAISQPLGKDGALWDAGFLGRKTLMAFRHHRLKRGQDELFALYRSMKSNAVPPAAAAYRSMSHRRLPKTSHRHPAIEYRPRKPSPDSEINSSVDEYQAPVPNPKRDDKPSATP